jgi:SAM-dependent methyltransferase
MNRAHLWYCSREAWKCQVREQLVPSATDPALAAKLRDRLGTRTEIVGGDGTAIPFADASFSAAACFTMLRHSPSPDLQDRLFAEVRRVLRPVGIDSTGRGIGLRWGARDLGRM